MSEVMFRPYRQSMERPPSEGGHVSAAVFTPERAPHTLWSHEPKEARITMQGQTFATRVIARTGANEHGRIGIIVDGRHPDGQLFTVSHCPVPVWNRDLLAAWRAMEVIAIIEKIEPFTVAHAYLAMVGYNGKIRNSVINAIGHDAFAAIADAEPPELKRACELLEEMEIAHFISPAGRTTRPR